jgi:hypothetical protein
VRYLAARTRKDELIEQVRRQEGLAAGGLIAVLSTLENCRSYDIYRDRSAGRIELRQRPRKCLPDDRGRRHRALNPLAPDDAPLLQAVSRGEFGITGLRNRDLRQALFGGAATAEERRRQAGRVTRKLALLRAHGLIRKIPGTHRYLVTKEGRTAISALPAVRNATLHQLIPAA